MKLVMTAASGAEQEARAVTGPKPILRVQGRSNRALQRRLRLRRLARGGHGCRFRLRPFPEVAVTFSAGTDRVRPLRVRALSFLSGACSCRRTGIHFSG